MYSSVRIIGSRMKDKICRFGQVYTKLGGGEYSSVSIGRKEPRSKEH